MDNQNQANTNTESTRGAGLFNRPSEQLLQRLHQLRLLESNRNSGLIAAESSNRDAAWAPDTEQETTPNPSGAGESKNSPKL